MTTYHARDIINAPKAAVLDAVGNYKIITEDGKEVILKGINLQLFRYVGDLYHKLPYLKIEERHLPIDKYLKNGTANPSTVTKMTEAIFDSMVKYLESNGQMTHKALTDYYKAVLDVHNDIYNELALYRIKDISTIDIDDILEVQMQEELLHAIRNVEKTGSPKAIKEAYNTLDSVMEKLTHNRYARAYRNGNININQARQVSGPRGIPVNTDSSIFKNTIHYSFTMGMRDPASYISETGSAAKALVNSTVAIQTSERNSRVMQVMTMSVSKIKIGDCGSTRYYEKVLNPPEIDDGKVLYPGDLSSCIGKYYLDEETNTLKVIDGTETHLYGKIVKFRSPGYCQLEDTHQVCSTCFGKGYVNIPGHANVGHYAVVQLMSRISQLILSTKHHVTSASGVDLKIPENMRQLVVLKPDDKLYFRTQALKYYKLYIRRREIPNIKTIPKDEVMKFDPSSISYIRYFKLVRDKSGKELEFEFGKGQSGSLTLEFIEHIKSKPLDLHDDDYYIVDLTDWKFNKPVMVIKDKEFSYLDLARDINSLLSDDNEDVGGTYDSFVSTLHRMVNTKLHMDLSCLEIIGYSRTTRDEINGDFRLSREPGTKLARLHKLDTLRNLSISLSFGYHVRLLKDPNIYKKYNLDHPMDAILKPKEVVERFNRYGKYAGIEPYDHIDIDEFLPRRIK